MNRLKKIVSDMKKNDPEGGKTINDVAVLAEIVPVKNILHFFRHIYIIQDLTLFCTGFFEDGGESFEDDFGVERKRAVVNIIIF